MEKVFIISESEPLRRGGGGGGGGGGGVYKNSPNLLVIDYTSKF